MGHLIALLASLALLVGFYALTQYEARRGARFFAAGRERLDMKVRHAEFIMEHVDFLAFVRDEVRLAANRLGHAIAHLSLRAVRAVERLLTRLVRYLRMRHDNGTMPHESAREFVKTLSDFKDTLQATHPDIPMPGMPVEEMPK